MSNAKILIVDDDVDLTHAISAILKSAGYSIVTADNREEGLATLRAEKPDLLILDVMMDTWQDGFEMSREIKKDPELKHIPILMLTAVKDKTGIEFKSTAGDPTWLPVEGFLDKPVDPELLLQEVQKLL
jgi:CheY-like chemotaxis protein